MSFMHSPRRQEPCTTCSCSKNVTKGKIVQQDLFQTPPRIPPSTFGAINSFATLPVLVLVYAVFLALDARTPISESRIIKTPACETIKFTCAVDAYGCEVAPLGEKTYASWPRSDTHIRRLESGESSVFSICHGRGEALDISARMDVQVKSNTPACSQISYSELWENDQRYGIFGSVCGHVYKVDLGSMQIHQTFTPPEDWLKDTVAKNINNGFIMDDHLFFSGSFKTPRPECQQSFGTSTSIIAKLNLHTFELEQTPLYLCRTTIGTSFPLPAGQKQRGSGLFIGFSLRNGNTGKSSEINVVKVNLTNFVLVKNVKTVDLDFGTGFSQDIVSSLAYSYDNPPVLYAALGHGEKLFAVDLNSLAVVAGYPASSIPSLPGFVTSSPVSPFNRMQGLNNAVWGLQTGNIVLSSAPSPAVNKSFSIGPIIKGDKDPVSTIVCNADRENWNQPVVIVTTSGFPSRILSGGMAGGATNYQNALMYNKPVLGVNKILTGFIDPNSTFVFYGALGRIVKLKVNFDGLSAAPGFERLPKFGSFEGMDEHGQANWIDFPEHGSGAASTFTLFSTRTNNTLNKSVSLDFMYQSQYIADFNELECQTSQASGLCRRINLAPIQMEITVSPKLGYVQLVSVFFSFVVSIIFGGLQFVTKYGWKHCCKSAPPRSSSSSFVAPLLAAREEGEREIEAESQI